MKIKVIGLALGALVFALCLSTEAQQAGKIFRIGYLDNSTASASAIYVDVFRQVLNKLGWIEGKNISIEYRFAEQTPERLPELATELVRSKVDLIVTSGYPAVAAAKKATIVIPIVMANALDPVGSGLQRSRSQSCPCRSSLRSDRSVHRTRTERGPPSGGARAAADSSTVEGIRCAKQAAAGWTLRVRGTAN